MRFHIPQRRLEGIRKDIEALAHTGISSLETGVDMTTDIMTLFIDRIRAENPTLTEPEILNHAREYIYLGRSNS
ncbi:MAG: hypothetical protein EAX86_01365 [Candidatus Heimdallarchaeota archaeon]|nr:hypothetical protein [Candidatus Heimdallarchaeota archaeon]